MRGSTVLTLLRHLGFDFKDPLSQNDCSSLQVRCLRCHPESWTQLFPMHKFTVCFIHTYTPISFHMCLETIN